MLRFISSLSFLYFFVIVAIVTYGVLFWKDFKRSQYRRYRFPIVFGLIAIACVSFLWINMHASLKMHTFSNLDHHFIQHDGFQVKGKVELGSTDTANDHNASFNKYVFSSTANTTTVHSSYSEDPFFISGNDGYEIASVNFPAVGHSIQFQSAGSSITIQAFADHRYELHLGTAVLSRTLVIKRGISCWNLFKDDETFINSSVYNDPTVISALQSLFILRDKVSKRKAGDVKYFVSGKIFRSVSKVNFDGTSINASSLSFTKPIADKSFFGWGIAFLENNKSQWQMKQLTKDSFSLLYRYPVSYPLIEENRAEWSAHGVSKFLVADSKDLIGLPGVFREGFYFSIADVTKKLQFDPLMLTYKKGAANDSIKIDGHDLNTGHRFALIDHQLLLPSHDRQSNWIFSIRDTYQWQFENFTLGEFSWQVLIFGSLIFFLVLIIAAALIKPAHKISWVGQLLACVTVVLLTTRFFMYWRYKSFPPFEGMDLPSIQQLNSFSNFLIIILATFLLALVFGWSFLSYLYTAVSRRAHKLLRKPFRSNSKAFGIDRSYWLNKIPLFNKLAPKTSFFILWAVLLIGCGAVAAVSGFDPGICRHLAIGLIVAYFFFLYTSYTYSPLVSSAHNSWWHLDTGKTLSFVISNPVKVLLSISLLELFVFVDIGFAIVFLNFLLFNEAFLNINYSIAGLSAGSRRNAAIFSLFAFVYMGLFILNLLFAPYIFSFLLQLSGALYIIGYVAFAILMAYVIVRLVPEWKLKKQWMAGVTSAVFIFVVAFIFFPKERILKKAEVTRYRIDVLTTPVDKAIESAYNEGKTYEPVIRAAQNQWFINTFIDENNNPGVQSPGFNLLPHAPQNKGARYNAQATDLVASRFFIAEHGKYSVLLYVVILLLPITMLGAFYKLYPDFTNRINTNYPTITAGFSILNYLLITGLLVILAATGRYIFFGQDLPFGSILSKQSILFPSLLIVAALLLFKNILPEFYSNKKKLIPGFLVFGLLAFLLFAIRPVFNNNKEFGVADLAGNMDNYVQERLQPVLDYFDTSKASRRLSLAKKDKLFGDSLNEMISAGLFSDGNAFYTTEIAAYGHSGFARHIDQRKMLYLDVFSGTPQLAVNDNYFRVEPPPHLQELWTGNVYGDSSTYNISLLQPATGQLISHRLTGYTNEASIELLPGIDVVFGKKLVSDLYEELWLVNKSNAIIEGIALQRGDSMKINNPSSHLIKVNGIEYQFNIEPDGYMKNYYVNGSRFYSYPLKSRFIWARNFSESIASEYPAANRLHDNAFVSFDYELMDSLTYRIKSMMERDSSYGRGAEYGISIADGNGRIIAMADFIKQLNRPDPNDKPAFNRVTTGDNGMVVQSQLRKQIGNINLLRMNPGPGSTLKPIVFTSVASQLNLNWDAFSSTGFSEPQQFYGGEKVAEYDFELNNGTINNISDYLKVSDNYYHSNVILMGSYPKQDAAQLIKDHFTSTYPGGGLHWPTFKYGTRQYWLQNFKQWPGYLNGKANFGLDGSSLSIGLNSNYSFYTKSRTRSYDMFSADYDSSLFLNAYRKSAFILPEYPLFDQQGDNVDHRIPYDLFTSSIRGHVKGSSQVMIPPIKMTEAFGKMVSQNINYTLTLDPYHKAPSFGPFNVDQNISYNSFLNLMKENVMTGMKAALFNGTAAALGTRLKNGNPYFYYAKTGTTGDNEAKTKSKLLILIISKNDMTASDFNFRTNKFFTVYFSSQNGPAKQNELFQQQVIEFLQESKVFRKYMELKKTDNLSSNFSQK